MTTTMSIRELTRSSGKIAQYDYIDIEDRRSHEYKGVLISAKYADDVKAFLEKKIAEEKQKKLDEVMRFAGILSGATENMSTQEIKAKKMREMP